MNGESFRPIADTKHFPLLSMCAEQPTAILMGCDALVFMAPEDLTSARRILGKEGSDWHLYGDTRWPHPSTWVEFPLACAVFSGACGVLVLNTVIPDDVGDMLGWVAENNPLIHILPEERAKTAMQERLDLMMSQSKSAETIPGPADSRPRHVQCYCIFHSQTNTANRYVAAYTDLLNDAGIPIPKYRTASLRSEDVWLCRFALHSLFSLNQARIAGEPILSCKQLQEFMPTLLSPDNDNPKWAGFHPSRSLRSRPAVRAMPSPALHADGIMMMEDFQRVSEVSRLEANRNMLAFDQEARPHNLAVYQEDLNASMAAFIHRANGGAIYKLPDRLVEEFDKTDCAEVQIGDIQLPFPNIYLSFTPPDPIYLADGAPVDGCYVVKQGDECHLMLTSRLTGVDYTRSLSVACLDPTFSLHLPASEPTRCINDAVDLGIKDFLARNAPPENDFSTTVERPDGTVSEIVDVRAQSRQRRIAIFQSQEPVFRTCLNIIINAACFIAFRPDDVREAWEGEPPKELVDAACDSGTTRRIRDKKRDALRTLENGDFTRIRVCGGNLFADDVPEGAAGHGVSPRAHWRRGHWRRQRHGVGLALVVLRWIRPTVVKRDNGPLVEARIYDVEQQATVE